MTREIHINPDETPTERDLANAYNKVDDIRSEEVINRDDLAAALDRRQEALEAVNQEKAGKKGQG